jgi:hypothetical protein
LTQQARGTKIFPRLFEHFYLSALVPKMETVMNGCATTERDEAEQKILNPEVSDRELELAAGTLNWESDTVNSAYACTENPCCFCT